MSVTHLHSKFFVINDSSEKYHTYVIHPHVYNFLFVQFIYTKLKLPQMEVGNERKRPTDWDSNLRPNTAACYKGWCLGYFYVLPTFPFMDIGKQTYWTVTFFVQNYGTQTTNH